MSNDIRFFYIKRPAVSLQEARYQTLCMFQSYFSGNDENNICGIKLLQKKCNSFSKDGIEIKSVEIPEMDFSYIKFIESSPNFIKWIDLNYKSSYELANNI